MENIENIDLNNIKYINHSYYLENWLILWQNSSNHREMAFQPQRGWIVVYGVFLTVWTVIVNFALASGIVVSRKQHKKEPAIQWQSLQVIPGRFLIFMFALIQIVFALMVLPLKVKTELAGAWPLGGDFCRVWLVAEVFLITVSAWCLVMLNMDTAVLAMKPMIYYVSLRGLKEFTMTLSCVTFGLAICLPVTAWMQQPDFVLPEVCASQLSKGYALTLAIGAFYLPGAMIIVATIMQGVALKRSHEDDQEIYGFASYKDLKQSFVTLLIVNLVFLLAWGPYHVSNTIIPFCKGGMMCINPHLWAMFIWFGYTASGLVPAVLLLNPMFRRAVGKVICLTEDKEASVPFLEKGSQTKVDRV